MRSICLVTLDVLLHLSAISEIRNDISNRLWNRLKSLVHFDALQIFLDGD